MTLCQQNIRVFDVRIKLIVTFSSSDTGTRYLPNQLIGEGLLIGHRTPYCSVTIISAGSSLACRCTNPPILWHAAAQLELLVAPSIALIPRLHYQPVSSRFSSCALTSPVSTSVCVYITTARTGLNQRQLVRLFHSTVAGSRAVPKHVRACRQGIIIGVTRQEWSRAREVVSDHSVSDSETMRFKCPYLSHMYECIEF